MIKLDEKHQIFNQYLSPCLGCKHFDRAAYLDRKDGVIVLQCAAFDEIPDAILTGANKHSKPLPDQGNEIVFDGELEPGVPMSSQDKFVATEIDFRIENRE